jgi:hypothetical protein
MRSRRETEPREALVRRGEEQTSSWHWICSTPQRFRGIVLMRFLKGSCPYIVTMGQKANFTPARSFFRIERCQMMPRPVHGSSIVRGKRARDPRGNYALIRLQVSDSIQTVPDHGSYLDGRLHISLEGIIMSLQHRLPGQMVVACAVCSQQMRITMATPAQVGRETRIYECACGHGERINVAIPSFQHVHQQAPRAAVARNGAVWRSAATAFSHKDPNMTTRSLTRPSR